MEKQFKDQMERLQMDIDNQKNKCDQHLMEIREQQFHHDVAFDNSRKNPATFQNIFNMNPNSNYDLDLNHTSQQRFVRF